jgi:hypothetical protein
LAKSDTELILSAKSYGHERAAPDTKNTNLKPPGDKSSRRLFIAPNLHTLTYKIRGKVKEEIHDS